MIDLKLFCSQDRGRPKLCEPWSGGEYSYASNGHILVRVKRQDVVTKEQPQITTLVESWLAKAPAEPMIPMPMSVIPQAEVFGCDACEGTGNAHPVCDDCHCVCELCDGSGKIEAHRKLVTFRGAFFNAKYWRMIMGLPQPYVATSLNELGHFHFTFYIGWGILMPMNQSALNTADKKSATVIKDDARAA